MAAELSRHSHNVNTKMRKAVGPDGDVLFRIGLPLAANSEIIKRSFASASFPRRNRQRRRAFSSRLHFEEEMMGRGILLWLLGVPITVIILLWLFFGR